MELDAAYFFVFAFPLGLAAFGLWIYMRDQIYKWEQTNRSSQKLIIQVIYIPFIYFKKTIQNKSGKGFLSFLLFWVFVLSSVYLIYLSNGSLN